MLLPRNKREQRLRLAMSPRGPRNTMGIGVDAKMPLDYWFVWFWLVLREYLGWKERRHQLFCRCLPTCEYSASAMLPRHFVHGRKYRTYIAFSRLAAWMSQQ